MSGKKLFRSALSIIITNVDIIFNECQPFVNDNSIKKRKASKKWRVEGGKWKYAAGVRLHAIMRLYTIKSKVYCMRIKFILCCTNG